MEQCDQILGVNPLNFLVTYWIFFSVTPSFAPRSHAFGINGISQPQVANKRLEQYSTEGFGENVRTF